MITKILSFVAIVTLAAPPAFAESFFQQLKDMIQKDPAAAESLALYPEDIRNAIFEIAQYPETLSRLATAQKSTSGDFWNLIKDYPRAQQEKVYDLVRYPQLLAEMTDGGKKSKSAIADIAKKYPEEIRPIAEELNGEYDLLVKISEVYQTSQQQFMTILRDLPQGTKTAFHVLIEYPEVITLLQDDLEFTTLLGKAYKADPEELQRRAANAAERITADNDAALEDWASEIDSDPDALQENEEAAKTFAAENGYNWDEEVAAQEAEADDDAGYAAGVATGMALTAIPYWFGYPTYYTYPAWRHYPLSYHTGWRYYGGRRVAWNNWPSHRYGRWYDRQPRARYNHLNRAYDRNFERHPNVNSGLNQNRRGQAGPQRAGAGPAPKAKQRQAPRAKKQTAGRKQSTVSHRKPSHTQQVHRGQNHHRSSQGGRSGGGAHRGGSRGGGGGRRGGGGGRR